MNRSGTRIVTLALAGFCTLMLMLAVALQIGLGRGYRWLPIEDAGHLPPGMSSVNRDPFRLPLEKDFAVTTQRPLFNDDRKPTPEGPGDDDSAPPPPKVALNIELTGIILSPDLQVALIHDKSNNSTVALKQGMPMPGDQGGWTLTEIKPRSAVFHETSGDAVEVELTTAVASPTPARPRVGRPAMAARQHAGPRRPGGAHPARVNRQAEQLQRRIEERRRQMREQAERLRRMRQKQAKKQ